MTFEYPLINKFQKVFIGVYLYFLKLVREQHHLKQCLTFFCNFNVKSTMNDIILITVIYIMIQINCNS